MPSPTLPLDCPPIEIGQCRRLSACCKSPVFHPNPASKRLSAALALICTECGKSASHFEVYTSQGVRIWPLPREFHAPSARKHNDLGRLWR